METVCLEVVDHFLGIRETGRVELIIALPVCGKPARVKMDHV